MMIAHRRLTDVKSGPRRFHKTQEDPFFAFRTKPLWICVRRVFWLSWVVVGNKAGWRRELYVSLLGGRWRFHAYPDSRPYSAEYPK